MDYVFVYGTLKSGFPNAHINQGQALPGRFRTLRPHPLYLVGERASPWLMCEHGGECVWGEVFAVDDLSAMDELERVNQTDGYQRIHLDVVGEFEDHPIRVWGYLKPNTQLVMNAIRLGPLNEYTLEHAELYRPRAQA